jgi:hypothetical protein
MNYSKLLLALLFSCTLLFAFPQEKKTINVQPGQRLVVDLETGADIIIEGWDKNIVEADVNIHGRDADKVTIDISETSYGVLIVADYKADDRRRSTGGQVKVKVPNKFDLALETMGGELSVENVDGDLEGTTMGGSLNLKNLKGEVDFSTMGGSIELVDSEVDGEVSTMGGSVLIENVVGDVDASTMGGSITQKNVKSSKSSPGKEVKIKSMGGAINVDEAMTGANVKTMGGSINVNKAAEYVKAETMGGDIVIKEFAGWVEAKTMGGDVEVEVKGTEGSRDVKLTSMGGDIKLFVPADLAMDIEIEIVYDEDDADKVDVISDFDLSEKVVDAERDWDNDTKKLIATGVRGNGSNRIRIETISGKVYLQKK